MSGITFREFYEGCVTKNKLAVGLAIDTVPEQPYQSKCYLPEADIYDPFGSGYPTTAGNMIRMLRDGKRVVHHDPGAPQLGVARTVTFLVSVVDGSTFCCSAKLGASIKTPHAQRELERLAGVLIGQKRAQAADFDPTR